jgi:hypothetical protein
LALIKHRRNRHARSWRSAVDRAIRSCYSVVRRRIPAFS